MGSDDGDCITVWEETGAGGKEIDCRPDINLYVVNEWHEGHKPNEIGCYKTFKEAYKRYEELT